MSKSFLYEFFGIQKKSIKLENGTELELGKVYSNPNAFAFKKQNEGSGIAIPFVQEFVDDDTEEYDVDSEYDYQDFISFLKTKQKEKEAYNESKIEEAEYQGRKVQLGKPMQGDVKKFKVYVKNPAGRVVKVNFGDPNMRIKKSNPKRRKSFRARHKCAQAKDRTKPKYWSCRMWSKKPVSKMVAEGYYTPNVYETQAKGLSDRQKNSIFGKEYLKNKIQETFNQDDKMNQPAVEPSPVITPTKPDVKPSRKNKPFLPPQTEPVPPKAMTEGVGYEVYHKTFSSAVQAAAQYAESKGYEISEDEWFSTIGVGPSKPKEGGTNRYTISLYKDGKLQRKALHIQVYGMSNNYELNVYIS